jgi:hypothetical protein
LASLVEKLKHIFRRPLIMEEQSTQPKSLLALIYEITHSASESEGIVENLDLVCLNPEARRLLGPY